MPRDLDPDVVTKLADCIELLPKYVNSPAKMPIVQDIVRRAHEKLKSDREVAALGCESLSLVDEPASHLDTGMKYRLDVHDAEYYRKKAEDFRRPVSSVWLSDTDKEALKNGFEEEEIFESLERQAALVAECLKEYRHPRDAERFRNEFSFVCGEALLHSQGVEVSPGVYKLEIDPWLSEAAKPLCNYLRDLASSMVPTPNSEFVALELLVTYFPVDASTVNRWLKRLGDSQKEKRGNRWYVDYDAFRRIPAVMQWNKLPPDKNALEKAT